MAESTDINATPLVTSGARLDYEKALELLMGLADFERSSHSPGHWAFHLERISLLMEHLGNPHLDVPTIHVAGTKGKGSTAAIITSMLTAEGYKVGLFTSPHLHRATERIRVGLEPVSPEDFAALVEQVWPVIEKVEREGEYGGVTYFEAITAMAFLHFKQIASDFQVIEVGLGGRLDTTNIVKPEVSVITSISLDHVATLGDTIAKIASEKAGIIKDGVPVVVAPQTDEAMAVFREVANERNAPLVEVGAKMSWRKNHADLEGQSFEVTGLRDYYTLWTPLIGDYQLENASTAIAAAETLADRGFVVSKESIVRGLRDVRWSARLEVLSRNGRQIVVDGAHNPYSVKRLVQSVRELFEFESVILIFGALGGHSARGMIAELAELAPSIIAVRSRHPRAAPSDIISNVVSEHGLPVVFQAETVAEGVSRALEIAGENDLILGTGSLAVVAEIIEEVRGIPPEVYPNIKPPPNPGANI